MAAVDQRQRHWTPAATVLQHDSTSLPRHAWRRLKGTNVYAHGRQGTGHADIVESRRHAQRVGFSL
jgi:hypothetical protein